MVDAKEVVQELQEMRDNGYLSDGLLRHAVKRIAASDDRFDWVGVYLLRDNNEELWLHNYVGSPTEHSVIKVGEGICGTAVAEGENQNVPDVTKVDNYLACDPDVQSEMVVLIRAGDDIFGQLDLDSEEPAAFTDEDEKALQAVADKLAEQLMAERR
jgi:L-methionine (R)-S-oxide reductase